MFVFVDVAIRRWRHDHVLPVGGHLDGATSRSDFPVHQGGIRDQAAVHDLTPADHAFALALQPVGYLLSEVCLIDLVGTDAQRSHEGLVQRMVLPIAEIHFIASNVNVRSREKADDLSEDVLQK